MYTSDYSDNMRRHIVQASCVGRVFNCGACGKAFKNKDSRRVHKKGPCPRRKLSIGLSELFLPKFSDAVVAKHSKVSHKQEEAIMFGDPGTSGHPVRPPGTSPRPHGPPASAPSLGHSKSPASCILGLMKNYTEPWKRDIIR